eukprot:CAMPEP_0178763786 /NCGR_PEP_ID=MMETSP0744-20121128/17388_1 /TAXON_ID=913974 /ORGANISM="Nitzschia punctata, Strain CCMP561" /LENGTH=284 /DNA_ID=CAMNT_0020418807 /DNA_START=93 /DNA_END=947 /DNA_ORIENTATION=+
MAQVFTFAAVILSLASLGDCAFAEISETALIPGLPTIRRVGLITLEAPDGSCYFFNSFENVISSGQQLEMYWKLQGSAWQSARVLSWSCVLVGSCLFIHSMTFLCSSQPRPFRFTSFILCLVVAILQGCTLFAFKSDFCDENHCSISRSAGFGILALFFYLIAAAAFYFSTDFPGGSGEESTAHNDVELGDHNGEGNGESTYSKVLDTLRSTSEDQYPMKDGETYNEESCEESSGEESYDEYTTSTEDERTEVSMKNIQTRHLREFDDSVSTVLDEIEAFGARF